MRSKIRTTSGTIGIACLAAVLAALPGGAGAQNAASAPTPAAPAGTASIAPTAADVTALAEEIAVLRAVKPVRATPDQLAALTTAVSAAQERLAQQAKTDNQALAALRDPVNRARQQLLPSDVNLNDPQIAASLQA